MERSRAPGRARVGDELARLESSLAIGVVESHSQSTFHSIKKSAGPLSPNRRQGRRRWRNHFPIRDNMCTCPRKLSAPNDRKSSRREVGINAVSLAGGHGGMAEKAQRGATHGQRGRQRGRYRTDAHRRESVHAHSCGEASNSTSLLEQTPIQCSFSPSSFHGRVAQNVLETFNSVAWGTFVTYWLRYMVASRMRCVLRARVKWNGGSGSNAKLIEKL